jgi:hypothetical protein
MFVVKRGAGRRLDAGARKMTAPVAARAFDPRSPAARVETALRVDSPIPLLVWRAIQRTQHAVLRCLLIVVVGAVCLVACRNDAASTLGASSSIRDLMKARGLNEADVEAALKTYVPSGKLDEYYVFAAGGQSGNVDVIGVPSMRMLKVIDVFTPEPWQGWGYGGDDGNKVLAEGNRGTHKLSWGDVHHPNLSETKGEYDGQSLFVNDKANARVAVIDLAGIRSRPYAAARAGGDIVAS